MKNLLKKYLLIKWWIPTLLFGISILLFIKNYSIFFLLISGLILFVSSIWQLFKGSKTTGVLQMLILTTPILLFGFMMVIFSGMMDRPDSELKIKSIEPLIKEKTNLTIPKNFEILENLIEHTEGAFDSDYSIELKIKYQESEEKNITEQILNSMKSKSDKGTWGHYETGFDFKHNNNESNRAEPFYFKVDTLRNRIEMNLSHL